MQANWCLPSMYSGESIIIFSVPMYSSGGDGVRVSSAGDINNLIVGNSIYANSGLGINLGNKKKNE